jgi:PAS domain S-box-containing protein
MELSKSFDPGDFSKQVELIQARLVKMIAEQQNPSGLIKQAFEELIVMHEELLVADAELRLQNEEIASARDVLEEERQRYQDLFEFAPDGYLVTDPDGLILEANQAASRLLGVPAAHLIGKPLAVYIAREDLKNFRWRLAKFGKKQASRPKRIEEWELRIKPRGGSPFYVAITAEAVRAAETLRWMIRDIRERKQAQAELEEVKRRLVESRDWERLQMARELHDGPVQDLYGVAFQLRAIQDAPDRKMDVEDWEAAHALLHHVISTLRTICGELRPPTLEPFGLEKAIASHAGTIQESQPGLKIHLDLSPDKKSLPEADRLALFRIYQQALANVIRHARASHAWVRLKLDDDKVRLEIQDDGAGFEVPRQWTGLARQGHLGLAGAAERAGLMGGEFQVFSSPGEGTTVKISIPVQEGFRNKEKNLPE